MIHVSPIVLRYILYIFFSTFCQISWMNEIIFGFYLKIAWLHNSLIHTHTRHHLNIKKKYTVFLADNQNKRRGGMKTYPKIEILASFGIEHHHRHRAAGRHNSVHCIPLFALGIGTQTHTHTHKNREFFHILLFWTVVIKKLGLVALYEVYRDIGPILYFLLLLYYYIIHLYVSQSAKAV